MSEKTTTRTLRRFIEKNVRMQFLESRKNRSVWRYVCTHERRERDFVGRVSVDE